MFSFLRLAPFDNNAVWKRMIGSGSRLLVLRMFATLFHHCIGRQGMQRLQAMVATLVLRRTKEEQGLAGVSVSLFQLLSLVLFQILNSILSCQRRLL